NLINRLSTNHTFFMREPQHFEFIQNSILPFWEENNKNKKHKIYGVQDVLVEKKRINSYDFG
ncbi:hypothetical protein BM530_19060, partial [Clostridioides difficile]